MEVAHNENGNFRGLHIVILNPLNYRVEFAQAFDTHRSPEAFDQFTKKAIPKGFIVCAVGQDDCAAELSLDARRWFAAMGSRQMYGVHKGDLFAFIGRMGHGTAGRANDRRGPATGQRVSVATICPAHPALSDLEKAEASEDKPLSELWQQQDWTIVKDSYGSKILKKPNRII